MYLLTKPTKLCAQLRPRNMRSLMRYRTVLKEFAFELAFVIADIYNASPLKSIETNIRPISLTCQVAKLLEGFTSARIYKPVLSDLDKKQFAVAGKSTEQALVYLLHIALEALDKENCSVRFFFANFRKGIDLINRGILLQKLCNYNIHNCLTRWVASFLQGRFQFTRIDNICSSSKVLRGWIPQGTKLGPIMFAVMVNDLLSRWRPRAKFVDDLTALEIIPRNSPSMMNFIVDDKQRFAVKNNMCLNPPKWKSMTINFLHYNSCVVSPIVTGGSTVDQVSSFKNR